MVVKDMSIDGIVAISDPRDRRPVHTRGEAISNKQACNVACIFSDVACSFSTLRFVPTPARRLSCLSSASRACSP